MRVLLVSHYFPPETPGGTQETVAQLARLLRDAGHDVGVVAGCRNAPRGGEVERTREEEIEVWRLPRLSPDEALAGNLVNDRIGGHVEDIASEFAPDLVHVHHWYALSSDLVRRLKAGGHRVVLSLHDLFTTCAKLFRMPDSRSFCARDVTFDDCARCVSAEVGGMEHGTLRDLLAARFAGFQAELAAADLVLAISTPQKELLESIPGFEFDGLQVSPIGITTDAAPPAPPPPSDRLRVVNWAGLDPRKGPHVLLRAVLESEQRDRMEVHLYGRDGEPEYMDELRALAEGSHVRFHGPYEDDERLGFAAHYDLAVFPFLAFETHALVVDEALRTGLPVVVSDHGAPPDRIGSAGVAVPADDSSALRACLEELLAAPERLAAMRAGSHSARDFREHFDDLVRRYRRLLA